MNQEFLLHLNFVLVFVLVGSHLGNFLLALDSLHFTLNSELLVLDGLVEATYPLLPLFLVLRELHHNLLKLHFGLDAVLFSLHLLISFFNGDHFLRLHGVLEFL